MSRLRNMTTGKVVATDVQLAGGVFSKIVGLLDRAHIEPSEGLWFAHCSFIHTLGMREAIDVVFLDRQGCVMRTISGVPPNKFAVSCMNAATTIELGSGALSSCDILVGDRFVLE